MSIARKLSSGTAFVSAATLLARIGTFLGNIAIIRLLSKNAVGELGLIESWIGVAVLFATLGINTSVTKYIAEYLESQKERVGRIIGAALLLTFAAGILAAFIVLLGSHFGWWKVAGVATNFLSDYGFLLAGLVFVQVVRAVVNGIIYGVQEFSSLVTLNIVIGLISFPLLYLFVHWRALAGALEAKLILIVIETLLMARVTWLTLRRQEIKVSFSGCRTEIRQLMTLGVPVLAGGLAAGPVQPMMMSFLAAQPGGIGQVALITTATRLSSMVNFLPTSVASILTPILASEWGAGEPKQFGRSLTFAMRMFWLSTLAPIVFFLAASPTLLRWLYGRNFVEAWPIAFALLIMALLGNLNQSADRALLASNRIWLSISSNFVWLLLFVPLAFWWIPKNGGMGYAAAFLLSFFLYVSLQMWYLYRLLHVQMGTLLKMVGGSLPFVAVALALALVKSPALQVGGALVLTAIVVVFEWCFLLDKLEKQKLVQRMAGLRRSK